MFTIECDQEKVYLGFDEGELELDPVFAKTVAVQIARAADMVLNGEVPTDPEMLRSQYEKVMVEDFLRSLGMDDQ